MNACLAIVVVEGRRKVLHSLLVAIYYQDLWVHSEARGVRSILLLYVTDPPHVSSRLSAWATLHDIHGAHRVCVGVTLDPTITNELLRIADLVPLWWWIGLGEP